MQLRLNRPSGRQICHQGSERLNTSLRACRELRFLNVLTKTLRNNHQNVKTV